MNFKRFFMKNFTDIANRLKTELSLTMDKEVAELLKMSKVPLLKESVEVYFLKMP